MLDALDPVDQWNDSQATLGVTRPVEEVEHHLQRITADDDLTVTGLKVTSDSPTDYGAPEGTAYPPLMQASQAHSAAPSVHSLPVRHASATHLARPSTAPSPLISESALCPSRSVTQVSVTASRRQLRHRSSNEVSSPYSSECPAGFDWTSSRLGRRTACLGSFPISSIVVILCSKLPRIRIVSNDHPHQSNLNPPRIRDRLLPLSQQGQPLPRLPYRRLLFTSWVFHCRP